MIPGHHTAFSNNQSLVSILHRELERKMEKLEHMKLEVMPPKIKSKSQFSERE